MRILSDREIGDILLDVGRDYGPPPVYLDRRGVGESKTHEALSQIVELIPHLEEDKVIYIFAPTTALCDEIASRLISLNKDLQEHTIVYRGRGAEDPHQKQPMCVYHNVAEVLSIRGGEPKSTLCRNKKDQCDYFDTCGYRRQEAELKSAKHKAVIQPHSMLSLTRRSGMKDPTFIVIDEDPYSALLDEPPELALDDLIAPLKVPPSRKDKQIGVNDPTSFLMSVFRQIHDALNQADGIALNRGFPSLDELRVSIEFLYRIVAGLPCALQPNPSSSEIAAFIDDGKLAIRIFLLIKLLRVVLRSHHKSQLIGCRVKERKIQICLKKQLAVTYQNAQTLILSATAQPMILKSWWSQLKCSSPKVAEAPHEKIIQYREKATKGLLGASKPLFNRIIGMIYHLSQAHRGEGLDGMDGFVVAQKEVANRLKALLPKNVEVGHFFAVAGKNTYKDVRFQVIIGRPLPHPNSLELIAEAIKGDAIDREDFDFYRGWYPKFPHQIVLKNASLVETLAEFHPDPTAFALMKSICEGEIKQANRARGVLRTANNPVTTYYVNEQPAPVAVDAVYDELKFDAVDVMVGKGLVVDANARKGHWRVISTCVAEWFKTPKAAERHFQNALDNVRSTPQTHISTLYGFGELNAQDGVKAVPFGDYVHVKLTMKGERFGVPVFIDSFFGDPEQHATNLLGPLDRFEIIGPRKPRNKGQAAV
jgi:hypothetical protein